MNDYLKKLSFWNELNDDEKIFAENSTVTRRYAGNTLLHSNCDNGFSCIGLIYIVSGGIRAFMLSKEGREITLFKLSAGDTCILAASCILSQISLDTQIRTTGESELVILPAHAFLRLSKQNINVKCYMYELSTKRYSEAMLTLQNVLFTGVDKRLASFLLSEYEKTGNEEIRKKQEQIAEEINSAREVISRMLRQFCRNGIVEYKKGAILLKDISALKELSEK